MPRCRPTQDNKGRLAHRAELVGKLCALTAQFKREELLDKLEAATIPAGPINDLDQVFADPQVIHRGMKLELDSPAAKGGKIPGIRTPIVLDGAPMASDRPSPRLGEHTAEILRELGRVIIPPRDSGDARLLLPARGEKVGMRGPLRWAAD